MAFIKFFLLLFKIINLFTLKNKYKRDMSYHQGITWPWLLGIYNDALKNVADAQKDKIIKKEQPS